MKLVLKTPVQEAGDLCSRATTVMSYLSHRWPLSHQDKEIGKHRWRAEATMSLVRPTARGYHKENRVN